MVNLEPGRHQHVVEQVEVGTTPQPVGMMVGIHLQLIDATGFDLKINSVNAFLMCQNSIL